MIDHLYRDLMIRLTLGAVLIAGVMGLAVYYYEIEKIDEAIVASVAAEARAFAPEAATHAPLSQPQLQGDIAKDLEAFLGQHRNFSEGNFIVAEIYDIERDKVAEAVLPGSEWVERSLKTNKHRFPDGDSTWYVKRTIDERLFIQALTPLRGDKGELLGYFEGVYEVSPKRVAEIADLIRTALTMVIASVLATALLLYPIIRTQQRGLVRLNQGLLNANIQTLEVLGSAIAKRDSDTHAHNFRVTLYAVRLAEKVGLSQQGIRELIKGSFLHDVGKIAISDTILLKPGKLDEAEFEIMKTHVAHGVDIVRRSPWLEEAARIVEAHHEKIDGTGYPHGLKGGAIPLGARIFAIADVFDALTAERPYKPALPLEETLAIMDKGAGSHFDAALLTAFHELAQELHAAFGGREDASVEEAARRLTKPYFEMA